MTLFIGGPKDGEDIKVSKDHYDFPERIEFTGSAMIFKNRSYRRLSIRSEHKTFDLMVLKTMNIDEAVERLIENYKNGDKRS